MRRLKTPTASATNPRETSSTDAQTTEYTQASNVIWSTRFNLRLLNFAEASAIAAKAIVYVAAVDREIVIGGLPINLPVKSARLALRAAYPNIPGKIFAQRCIVAIRMTVATDR